MTPAMAKSKTSTNRFTNTDGAHNTLVHYDNPIMIDTTLEQYLHKHNKLQNNTELILNNVLPPRQWYDKYNQLWLQYVSTTPGTESDVTLLLQQLSKKYNNQVVVDINNYNDNSILIQCFNEVIRHILLSCSERGILLVKIRDSMNDTLNTYHKLYQSCIGNTMYTVLAERERCIQHDKQYLESVHCNNELQQQVQSYQNKINELNDRHVKQRAVKQQQHAEHILSLQQTHEQLTHKLKQLLKLDTNTASTITSNNNNLVTA